MPCIFVNTETPIPLTSKAFLSIIDFYLFNCPARTHNEPNMKLTPDVRYDEAHYVFRNVCWRGKNFKDRGLDGGKLNSLRAAMMRMADSGKIEYQYYSADEDIVSLECISDSCKCDPTSEFIIRKGSNISQTEGIFYAIRNSFAHGSFEVCKVVSDGKKRAITMYKLENIKKGKTKAIIQLREKTLLNWIELVNMPIEEIKRAGK